MRRLDDLGRGAPKVAQVSTADVGGGAENIAADLHEAYLAAGWDAQLLVGQRLGSRARVYELPNDASRGAVAHVTAGWADKVRSQSARGARVVSGLGQPRRAARRLSGLEDFDFPGTQMVVDVASSVDLVHLHNLHGGYFDLRLLPAIARQAAVLMTLHDGWLMTGHCAHSLECDRWMTGCGSCPDLSLYPAVARDATAANWRRKQSIISGVRGLHVATPSRWLMDRVDRSLLAEHVADSKVIPNGVDTEVFAPGDRAAARSALGLPREPTILLAAANGLRSNVYKDYATLEAALRRVSESTTQPVLVLLLGDHHEEIQLGAMTLRFIPMVRSAALMASYYVAADLFVHAARADTFPTAVLEALASGLPVVGSRVGGIPEQLVARSSAEDTGLLVPPADPRALARAIGHLLDYPGERVAMGSAAAKDARVRFDRQRQSRAYVDWADEIVGSG